jgi:hypothetical protein
MSLQLCIFPHKCLSCGHKWTHSTTHGLDGSWVDSTQHQYLTDRISHLVLFKEVADKFCFRCIAPHTPGLSVYDHNKSQPPSQNKYSDSTLEDLLK